jgi:hypothetical protein
MGWHVRHERRSLSAGNRQNLEIAGVLECHDIAKRPDTHRQMGSQIAICRLHRFAVAHIRYSRRGCVV